MAKSVSNLVLDAALSRISASAVKMIACSSEPTTYTQANTTYALADTVVGATSFTIADGSVSGRKTTVSQHASVTIDSSGTFGHVALVSTATLLYVTTGTSQVLTAGNTCTFPAWSIEIADPT